MATEVDLNRWREAGKEIGRKLGVIQERERIIKLLETHAHDIPTLGACYDTERPDFIKLPREDIDELIADIKGENK